MDVRGIAGQQHAALAIGRRLMARSVQVVARWSGGHRHVGAGDRRNTAWT
jgi:hypothetical protein